MSQREHTPLTPEERELAQRLSRLDAQAAPSAELDARILAAARAGVEQPIASPTRTPTRRRRRWPVGLGVAASLLVAVGIAWQLRPLPETQVLPAPSESGTVPHEPATDTAPAAVVLRNAAPAASAEETAVPAPPPAPPAPVRELAPEPPARDEYSRQQAGQVADDAQQQARAREAEAAAQRLDKVELTSAPPPPPPPAPAPQAPPAPVAAEPVFVPSPPPDAAVPVSVDKAGRQERRALAVPPPAPASAGTAAGRMLSTEAGAADARVERIIISDAPTGQSPVELDMLADQPLDDQPPASADSPAVREHWLQRIRELRDDGDTEAARASLREFVRRHPQAEVPVDLRPLLAGG